MNWIVIAKSCPECGGDVAFNFYDHEPTEDEKSDVSDALGGMFCITVFVSKIEPGSINVIKNELC